MMCTRMRPLLSLSCVSVSVPAEVKRMLTIYIDERMQEMDKDGNGKVILEEYIRKCCPLSEHSAVLRPLL